MLCCTCTTRWSPLPHTPHVTGDILLALSQVHASGACKHGNRAHAMGGQHNIHIGVPHTKLSWAQDFWSQEYNNCNNSILTNVSIMCKSKCAIAELVIAKVSRYRLNCSEYMNVLLACIQGCTGPSDECKGGYEAQLRLWSTADYQHQLKLCIWKINDGILDNNHTM